MNEKRICCRCKEKRDMVTEFEEYSRHTKRGRICVHCEERLQHYGTKTYGNHPNTPIINPRACERAREIVREVEAEIEYQNNLPKPEDVFRPLFNDLFVWENGKMNNYCDMQNKMLTMV